MASEQGTSSKLKGTLLPSLYKVQKQVQPKLTVGNNALVYLEGLIIRLLYQLCSGQPHSIPDLEEKIQRSFPNQMITWAITDAQATIARGKKKTLTFSVDKLQPIIQKEVLAYKIDQLLAMYLVAVLEYISADILKLAGNYVKNIRRLEITEQDIKVAMGADKVLLSMFHYENIELTEPVLGPSTSKRGSLMYIEVLKDFRIAEEQYLRELNVIIKLFQEPMSEAKHLFSANCIETVFSNIKDIQELTVKFYNMIETAFEMANDNSGSDPLIGQFIEDLAVSCEFDYYDTYAMEQITDCHDSEMDKVGTYRKIRELLKEDGVKEFFIQKGLLHAVKYILPKLLYGPIYHCQDYFEYFRQIMMTSPDGEDREFLDTSLDVLRQLQSTIEKVMQRPVLKRSAEAKMFYERCMGTAVPNATAKILSIQENIEGWEGKDLSQIASLFLKEGTLMKVSQEGKKFSERKIFLFDNLLLSCKPTNRITGFTQAEYRLKERINLRKAEICDLSDTPCPPPHSFEVSEPGNTTIILSCKDDDDEKYEWLSFLMSFQHRSTLDRMLDAILQDEERSIELCYPDPKVYNFAEEDSEENIVFEECQYDDGDVTLIKGGKLYKLVERLTYHLYPDPNFVSVFLTTYRSFSNPVELLNLLISRYRIPNPETNEVEGSPNHKAILKRFKKEYIQPVQLRILNVLRHWVDHHMYDFERDHGEDLLSTLQKFLKSISSNKTAKKWVNNIERIVRRRFEVSLLPEQFVFNTPAPAIEWHLATTLDKFSLMTLHPLEIGRQLTLMHSKIFRAIKPSELIGTGNLSEGDEKMAPNKTKLINLTNRLVCWYNINICEAQNFEERVAVYSRIIDILQVFLELNNFNGIKEIIGAFDSAPVHRLQFTVEELTQRRGLVLEECRAICDTHNVKYMEKLRSINPPCVPFLGIYLSNILKTECGNPDFLGNNSEGLINFSKWRMVAAITREIRKYQDTPYNLEVQPLIRQYFEDLNPMGDRTDKEMNDYLYDLSLKVEPRNAKQPPKFPRITRYSLRHPGTKPTVRDGAASRKSSTHSTNEYLPSSPSSRRRPPSPSPSMASVFSAFTIKEDEDDEKESEPPPEESPPPPPLLPRQPTVDLSPPYIIDRPEVFFKQCSDNSDNVFPDECDEVLAPPILPPRTPATPLPLPLANNNPFELFVLPEIPPLPKRTYSTETQNLVSRSNLPPPVLPPRNCKPSPKTRHSDSIEPVVPALPPPLPVPKNLNVPPQLPPRRTQPK